MKLHLANANPNYVWIQGTPRSGQWCNSIIPDHSKKKELVIAVKQKIGGNFLSPHLVSITKQPF